MKTRGKKLIGLLLLGVLALGMLFGCGGEKPAAAAATGPDWSALTATRQVPLKHAAQFSLTEYEGGYTLLDIPTSGRFLIVPEGAGLPRGLDDDIIPLYAPLDRMYLAATSSMDFFRALGSVGAVRLSGTDVNGWYIEEAKAALADGSMIFAGKYSAPDYELIFAEKCDLAIESTMIYHSPEVKEQLEKLGVPVLVERSSYEEDPLGRMEWVKVYGALLGKLPAAEALFDGEVEAVEPLLDQPKTGKTVAFFYITTTGTVNVRKSSDYVPRMIALAGGDYAFPDLSNGKHDHGVLLRRGQGRGRAHLQQHHRRGAVHPFGAAAKERLSQGFQGRADRRRVVYGQEPVPGAHGPWQAHIGHAPGADRRERA